MTLQRPSRLWIGALGAVMTLAVASPVLATPKRGGRKQAQTAPAKPSTTTTAKAPAKTDANGAAAR